MADAFFTRAENNGKKYSSNHGVSMKGELKIPSIRKRPISLSDIIAATIGEEARSCDSTSTSEVGNASFNFLDSICSTDEEFDITFDGDSVSNAHDTIIGDVNKHEVSKFNRDSSGYETNSNESDKISQGGNSGGLFLSELGGENSNNACDFTAMLKFPSYTSDMKDQEPQTTEQFGFDFSTSLGFDTELDFLSTGQQCEHTDVNQTTQKEAMTRGNEMITHNLKLLFLFLFIFGLTPVQQYFTYIKSWSPPVLCRY